jgi:ABC-2 type transport system permease protein
MSKLLIVAQQEIWYHLGQWSFYLTIILMPLVFAAIGAVPRLRSIAEDASLPSVETILDAPSTEIDVQVGYVDYAGLITILPETKTGGFRPFADEVAATKALEQGRIESYYVIAADYLQSGQVVQYSAKPQLLVDTDRAVQVLLRDNLLQTLADPSLAGRLERPVKLVRHGPPRPVARFIPADLDLNRLVSAGLVVGVFVYVINVGGNLLLRALQREVRARVLEVMVVSTTSGQFIGGKLLGLTSLTLAQAGITLLAGVLVYGQNPDGSGPAALPLTTLALSVPYLVFGFVAYCSGIMAIAAMWPDFRESGALLAALRLLSLSPLIGGLFILPNADGPLSVVLTVFPLTSHLLMPFRMLITVVPAWQWSLGLLVLVTWTAFNVWLSTRLFRAHSLLTGRSVAPKVLWQALWH